MKTALIALDYIIDIMHPEGKISKSAGQASERKIVEKINLALDHARNSDWLTVLVKVGFHPGYLEHPKSSPMLGKAQEFEALALGERGTEFHPDLKVSENDAIVVKPRVSAFYGTYLEPLLRAQKIERIVIAGVSTTWAVQATARDAHDRDYQILVLEDACAAADSLDHEASIRQLANIAKIIKLDELVKL